MSAACCCRTISEKHKSARQLLSTALGPTGTCRRPAQPDDAATGIAGLLPNVHAISRGRRNFARWPVHSMTRATNPSRTMSTYAARSASRREQWQDAMHHCPLSPLMNTLNTTPVGIVSEDRNMTGRPGTVWTERIEAESPSPLLKNSNARRRFRNLVALWRCVSRWQRGRSASIRRAHRKHNLTL